MKDVSTSEEGRDRQGEDAMLLLFYQLTNKERVVRFHCIKQERLLKSVSRSEEGRGRQTRRGHSVFFILSTN